MRQIDTELKRNLQVVKMTARLATNKIHQIVTIWYVFKMGYDYG